VTCTRPACDPRPEKNDFDLKNDILTIDGVTLHDFDFIDLGKVLEPSGTVPATIKSLVFQF
jgi:ethanolamine utilization protein EutA